MATAGKFRAEAARMREFARTVTDPEILAELEAIIAEWERRARALGNGDGADCSPEGRTTGSIPTADGAPGIGEAVRAAPA